MADRFFPLSPKLLMLIGRKEAALHRRQQMKEHVKRSKRQQEEEDSEWDSEQAEMEPESPAASVSTPGTAN
eukprot:3512972-Pleurochrysis_carterae.AAC.1